MIKEAIRILSEKRDLPGGMMKKVFYELMEGKAAHEDMKSFLAALADKGETVDEIAEAAVVMRDKMKKISLPYETVLDTCGTGGGVSSFNVSTVVALIAAASGAKVAKHGNRSYTSHCGSADILEKLGVRIDLTPEKTAECIKEVGVGFLFAPLYHSAMKHVIGARKELKRRTIFNVLGPLSNPAGANAQVIGAFEQGLTTKLASVLRDLGTKRAFVVHGMDGFDEVSISGESALSEVKDGKVTSYKIRPEDLGLKRAAKEDVACSTIGENLDTVNSILAGKKSPRRDMALINAAPALVAAGLAGNLREGLAAASAAIDSGKAKTVLERLAEFTNS